MKHARIPVATAAIVVFLANSISSASAAGAAGATVDLQYPELMVIPRSSERLEAEAAKERENRWLSYAPIQASALMTFAAGILQEPNLSKDPDKASRMAGLVVGGGWLATTVILSAVYKPYSDSAQEVGAMPKGSQREQLARERAAEEAIRRPARLASRLKWLSLLSNLGASGYMLWKSDFNSFSVVFDGVSAIVAMAPVIFRSPWEDVAHQQNEYKKRIYAPVASAGFMLEPGTGKAVPALALSMSF